MPRPICRIFLAAIFALSLPCGAALSAQPNVLWISADDHAAYVTGAYGNRQVRTPNLDALAARGMRFDRAYCNSPVCTASRQSYLTGRYPRTIGVTLLRTPLPEAELTLADLLGDAGYQTASIGKMHFNSNLKHGFQLRQDMAEFRRMLRQRGRQPLPEGVEVLPAWKPFRDPARVWLNGIHRPFGAVDADMPGTWLAEQAADYLTQPHDAPFFLMVSFYEPHSPFRYPVEFRDRHDPATFDVPKVGPEDHDQIPAIFRDLSHEDKQGIRAAYYTSVEYLDKNVGIVLDALKRSGAADNTLVIYTGDHGYMLGQHGRFEKHCSYEPAVRAPLFISDPGTISPASSSKAFTEFVDIVPTVLEFSGVDIPHTVQGKSLKGLLTGQTETHRDRVIVEYAQNDEVMVRDERWKLVFQRGKRRRTDGYDPGTPLPGHTLQLFDLQNDPQEMHNLADEKGQQQRVAKYLNILVDHLRKTSRRPELIPKTDDPLEILDYCVQPRDIEKPPT